MTKWKYGDHAKDYIMNGLLKAGTGIVKVHDIFDPLPEFMLDADCIFVDPPYNQSMLKGYYTKAGLDNSRGEFDKFTDRLFECIAEINPKIIFLEIGKQNLEKYMMKCTSQFKTVGFVNATYYHNADNKCYLIYATNHDEYLNHPLKEGIDESDAIDEICRWLPDGMVIGDLCMGVGLVGISATKYNKPYVGTELNPNRLAKLLYTVGVK